MTTTRPRAILLAAAALTTFPVSSGSGQQVQRTQGRVAARGPALCPTGAGRSASTLSAAGAIIEDTPVGRCLARAAAQGSGMAALRLGDLYRGAGARLTGVDAYGREIEWYRLASARGINEADLRLMELVDVDDSRQMTEEALAYGVRAIRSGSDRAADAVARAYAGGRIAAGKLYFLRGWLAAQQRLSPAALRLHGAVQRPAPPLRPI